MPIADQLVDAAAKNGILSFMDGHSSYNQIYIAEEDISKTAFRCPGSIGTFEWVVMLFSLQNAGATYQRAMNAIFHDIISRFMEVYIDDVIIKSSKNPQHLINLEMAFKRMRMHKLKMNPLKCAFGVSAGNFLGFLVHQRGIEIDKNKAKAIMEAQPPQSKNELQRFLGQVGFLRRFISNHAGKTHVFSSILKLKETEDFQWANQHQEAFEELKRYLVNPPVMMPPIKKQPLRLYLSAAEESIGTLLAQNNEWGKEQAIYFLSRLLTPVECRYTPIEKLCLALYYSAMKLRIYMLPVVMYIVSQIDLIKYMLLRPLITRRIGKWSLALMEFSFKYIPQKAVKGRGLAEFLADHPSTEIATEVCDEVDSLYLEHSSWTLLFDGLCISDGGGAKIVIISLRKRKTSFSFFLDYLCTNNQAEYESLIIGLEILLEMKARSVLIIRDSKLVINQLADEYRCLSHHLRPFHFLALQLIDQFDDYQLQHWPKHLNKEADRLAQVASSIRVPPRVEETIISIKRRPLPSIEMRNEHLEVNYVDLEEADPDDWRIPIIKFLMNPSTNVNKKIQLVAPHYILMDGELYKKSKENGLLLRCLDKLESIQAMGEVHNGLCGAHQAGTKMRWLLRRVSAIDIQLVVKIWLFRGWALDFIGKITPPSTDDHTYIVVATDYFTKWVEAIPLKSCVQSTVMDFIEKHIIHRFRIPKTITTDRSFSFLGSMVQDLSDIYNIQFTSFTLYFAQANGQAEASNKVIIGIIEKMIEKYPRQWHNLLSEALWAYRNSKRTSTGVIPYMLTYGHDAVLPMEMTVKSTRVAFQNELTPAEYTQAMLAELKDLDEVRLSALDHVIKQKEKVMRAYNKKVKAKSFLEGDMVWKVKLPLGTKHREFGKWTPKWEGPFLVERILGK
ncbi:uncharacterized protein LOC132316693 [Cornus florida]|uniref:uncharacterized protein LOC132316693 n=1 Tax=Cornus florida TaxID=4283 RepID=UPI002896934F|nr:uncharacterized protein LOC132316693 [Cornus florida]